MRQLFYTVSSFLVLALIVLMIGGIGFTYPRVIESEPLENPIRIKRLEGNVLILADERRILLDPEVSSDQWAQVFREANHFVDVEGDPAGMIIYAVQDGLVCGTPWASPRLRIPIVGETVYKNKRELVAIGELIDNAQEANSKTTKNTPF